MKILAIVFLVMFIISQFSNMTLNGNKVTNIFIRIGLGIFSSLIGTIIFGLPILGLLSLFGL